MKLVSSDIDEIVDELPADFWNRFAGKNVLLTGGRGFLGRYFTEVFLAANARVLRSAQLPPVSLTVMDNLIACGPAGKAIGRTPGVQFVQHDVTQPMPDLGRVDYILHAAGIASPAWYQKFPVETYRVAAFGTANVLELAERNKGCRMLFFSSSEIYGNPDPKFVPTAETYNGYVSCLGPRACYDESKRMGEMMVRVHHQQRGVEGCIVRPFNFYGPGMQPTDYRVLPNFAARWVEDKPLQVYGDGRQTRTFCYVTDGIRGALRALAFGHPGEAYNIGNPNPEISVRDLARTIGHVTGAKLELNEVAYPDTYPADEPMRRCPDISKAMAHLNYKPLVSLETGIERFFRWADVAFREVAAA